MSLDMEGQYETEEQAFEVVERIKADYGWWPGVRCHGDGSFTVMYSYGEIPLYRLSAPRTKPEPHRPSISKAKAALARQQQALPFDGDATPPWNEEAPA